MWPGHLSRNYRTEREMKCTPLRHNHPPLGAIANDRVQLPEGAQLEVMDISARCASSAQDDLEYAVDALLQWLDQVESVKRA